MAMPLPDTSGEGKQATFDPDTYRSTTIDAFDHPKEHNEAYLDDGTENAIDEYCALLAATELHGMTDKKRFSDAVSDRIGRCSSARSATTGTRAGGGPAADRPFFHAVEEGLLALVLCRFLEVVDAADSSNEHASPRDKIVDALAAYWAFELEIISKVTNPFGYARAYVKAVDKSEPRASFFFPPENETGY